MSQLRTDKNSDFNSKMEVFKKRSMLKGLEINIQKEWTRNIISVLRVEQEKIRKRAAWSSGGAGFFIEVNFQHKRYLNWYRVFIF